MAENKKAKPAKGPDRKANRRGAARLAAVQALYQMDIGGAGINDIFAEFESHWLGNGIITVNTDAQAWARARAGELNKGGDAARAALAMVRIKRRLTRI